MKTNIVLPIAGNGQRFVEKGYTTIKPLIDVNGKYLVERSMESVDTTNANLIFIVREEHVRDFDIAHKLRSKFGALITVITVDKITEGALCTCLLAEKYIDNESPLVIFTPDCYFEPRFYPDQVSKELDGVVCVFPSDSPAHSFVQLDENNLVTKAAEKEVISNLAVGGLYYFKEGHQFVKYAKKQIENNMRTKGEYYICPVYNLLIEDGLKIGVDKNTRHDILGTPEDLEKHIKK